MSLRRIDPRFVLAAPVRTAVVLGGLDEWRDGLREVGVGVDVGGPLQGGNRPDLAVAPQSLARAAAALGAPAVIVEGPAQRELAAAGLRVQRLLPRPTRERPSLLLPLDQRLPAAYAIRHWSVVDRRWKVLRRTTAATLVERGFFPSLPSTITVGQRSEGPPAIVAAAAQELGLPSWSGWALALGLGDELSRNLFHVFRPGEAVPDSVIKFARVAGYVAPFERDEFGLELAAAAGGSVASRAPRPLGRVAVDGVEASVETAAIGPRLRELLTRPGDAEDKARLVEEIAAWILEVGRETATSAELTEERTRLLEDVVPRWREFGATPELVLELPALPAVLQHNDVGSWNIVVRDGDFKLVDWESARRHGLPLWDLFYFLADALALLDGETSGETRHRHTAALFRGERASSAVLFRWTRAAVQSLQIPHEAVGAIATLCWLHHSLSRVGRRASLDLFAPRSANPIHGTELVAETWLADPALGPGWDAWRR